MQNKTCKISKDTDMTNTMSEKNNKDNIIFQDYQEYWHFTKYLSQYHRDLIYASLPSDQQHLIRISYNRGGWKDMTMRDAINRVIDNIKLEFGYDMVAIRCKVLSGKSVYMSRVAWDHFISEMENFETVHSNFVFKGIMGVACKKNSDVVLVVRDDIFIEE